jgi:hypothetical protein
MGLDKKQLKAEYKDRPLDGGILLIGFTGSQQQFLLPARDIKSTQNRLLFMLEMQNCTHKQLQAAWDTCGADSLHFELAEHYKPNDEAANIDEDLRILLHLVAQNHPQAIVLEPARI